MVRAVGEDLNKSAKDLQPCLERMEVKLMLAGPEVGASASGEVRTWLM